MRNPRAVKADTLMSWDTARERILARTPVLPTQRLLLEKASGFMLAEPLRAQNDAPPFDVSAVDGFAVCADDLIDATEARPARLRLAGVIHAGDVFKTRLVRGTTIKIMTGGCVPRGAGAIVMREYCQEEGTTVTVFRRVERGENIRPRGGEFRKGQRVLPLGATITPPVVGLLAAFGYARVCVHRYPRVTIVVTGDELLAPSQPLRPGKIRDSNSYALAAAVRGMGIETCRVYRVGDQPSAVQTRLRAALRTSEVLLTVGGVSVGDHDHVRPILNALGVQEQFWRMAIKPGKPAYFGTFARSSGKCVQRGATKARGTGLVFGLPGNPVSALVCFHQLVKPALLRMMGGPPQLPLTVSARLVGARRKPPGRLEWLRGCLSSANGELQVEPVSGQDSHMLGGLAKANCLIHFPQDADYLPEGTQVLVEFLSW